MNKLLSALLVILLATAAWSKIPPPLLSDEDKAKAVEAAAKTTHGGKVASFQLCQSMDAAAANYLKTAKAAGKDVKPATGVPACADPGPFTSSAAPAAPAAAAAPAATAPKAAPAKKS